jgi:hypothetical protein
LFQLMDGTRQRQRLRLVLLHLCDIADAQRHRGLLW